MPSCDCDDGRCGRCVPSCDCDDGRCGPSGAVTEPLPPRLPLQLRPTGTRLPLPRRRSLSLSQPTGPAGQRLLLPWRRPMPLLRHRPSVGASAPSGARLCATVMPVGGQRRGGVLGAAHVGPTPLSSLLSLAAPRLIHGGGGLFGGVGRSGLQGPGLAWTFGRIGVRRRMWITDSCWML